MPAGPRLLTMQPEHIAITLVALKPHDFLTLSCGEGRGEDNSSAFSDEM